MRRGEIYWAELDPRSGAEQTGRRPVIVVSHDGFNEVPTWCSVIVVPVSTSEAQARRGPTAVVGTVERRHLVAERDTGRAQSSRPGRQPSCAIGWACWPPR